MSTYSERRCDRCGREIKINQFPTLRTNLIRTIKFLGFSPHDYVDRKYELCDKCTKEFEKFIAEGGDGENE